MASSRASSPASETSPTPPLQLTPNSKVKALLASFGNDSDEESVVSGSARARLRALIAKKAAPTAVVENAGGSSGGGLPQESEKASEDDEEEEEEIIRPKGRMAVRMLAYKDNSGGEQSAKDARERVKKMLMAKTATPEPTTDKENVDDSDDNEVPVLSRKRKVRTTRRATPVTSPRDRSASPGLFVSPAAARSGTPAASGSDSDLPTDLDTSNDRFKALVEKKRKEAEKREADAAVAKAKKRAEQRRQTDIMDEDEDLSDDNAGIRLTQQSRPTRRASKKALEDIGRETQRMSRNMQLTHKAITKKKFEKQSLFARFNFKTSGPKVEDPVLEATSSSPAAPSDAVSHETPPTSPASSEEEFVKETSVIEVPALSNDLAEGDGRELPSLEDALASSPPRKLDKGKGKAVEVPQPSPEHEMPKKKYTFKQRPVRIRQPKVAGQITLDNSDSDLEIVSKKPDARTEKLDSIFARVPEKQAKESHSLHVLKMLSHVTSPGKHNLGRNNKSGMTTSELQVSLQQRARQQALLEREEKLQALRDRGIIILTAEERQQELAEVEDLVAKARREGEEIGQRERAAAKKERKANGETDPLGESSDDEDWKEGKQVLAEELSGSDAEEDGSEHDGNDASGEEEDEEDEEEEEDAMDMDETEITAQNSMFDNEADETDVDEAEGGRSGDEVMAEPEYVEEDEEQDNLTARPNSRRTRKSNVISDDEDDEDDGDDEELSVMETPLVSKFESPVQLHADSPAAPTSVLRSATKTFIPGLSVVGPAGLGLTQIFAGTMGESQEEPSEASPASQPPRFPQMESRPDAMAFLKRRPAPELPPFVPTPIEDSQDVVMDSQSGLDHDPESQNVKSQTQGIQLGFSQSQIHGFDSLIDPLATQMSDFPDATQDVGFKHMTPIRGRFVDAPPSTVDTVILGPSTVPELIEETPIVKKKGKLRRRAPIASFSDEEDANEAHTFETFDDNFEISANVFDVMRKASKKKAVVVDEFDKKKSEAKNMVNEQADESEDEFAGLGGASDDESGGEEDEYVKAMIDDEGGKDLDERKLAAFFADRERANDEKQVEKLYNDITKGMLRRKRGADYDLSDSDDGGEARRRMKQKEFAKMRKALLTDERIGKIAENPKKQAFLRAIEDRGSEDEMDFLEDFKEQGDSNESQSQGDESQQRVPDSQPDMPMGSPKRKFSAQNADMRPPPHVRRTNISNGKKPSNLSEIRESLSSLIEEPNAMAPTQSESDTDDELEIEGDPDLDSQKSKDKENRDPFALRRTDVAVVDRISLKRASSSSLSANTRLAFSVSSSAPGFKVPPLLRRATTNSSITSGSSSSNTNVTMSATERMAGGASDGIKRGGGKNSGVNYFARDIARKAVVAKTEKRREQKRVKGAEVRRKVVGGLFGGGKFE